MGIDFGNNSGFEFNFSFTRFGVDINLGIFSFGFYADLVGSTGFHFDRLLSSKNESSVYHSFVAEINTGLIVTIVVAVVMAARGETQHLWDLIAEFLGA